MPSSSYQLVLTSSPDGPIMAYDASTGAPVALFTGTRSPRRGLTVVGKGFIAASHVSPDTDAVSIHLYNWYTSTVFYSFPVPEFVAPLAATSDGGYVFAGGQSGSIHCFSLPSGDMVRSFPAHTKPISCLKLSDDGSLVISGSDDGSIVVTPTFQLAEASLSSDPNPKALIMHQLKAHSDSITAFTTGIGPCNSTLISSSLDCTCKFWNLLDATLLRTVTFPCAIFGVALDSSDSHFFAAGSDGSVFKGPMKAHSRKKQSKAQELVSWGPSHNGPVVSVVLVNEGRNLVSAGEDGSVWMWEVEKEQVAMVMRNSNGIMGGSISDMIVASGTEYRGRGSGDSGNYGFSFGLFDEEVVGCMKKIMELGDILRVVVEDRKRAIDMLESAIAMYERLLELILEEALKGTGRISEEEEEGKEEKDDKQ